MRDGEIKDDQQNKRFAWKRLSDGQIVQGCVRPSKDSLFESAGFGAVRVNEPIKGFLAVEVVERNGIYVERETEIRDSQGVVK